MRSYVGSAVARTARPVSGQRKKENREHGHTPHNTCVCLSLPLPMSVCVRVWLSAYCVHCGNFLFVRPGEAIDASPSISGRVGPSLLPRGTSAAAVKTAPSLGGWWAWFGGVYTHCWHRLYVWDGCPSGCLSVCGVFRSWYNAFGVPGRFQHSSQLQVLPRTSQETHSRPLVSNRIKSTHIHIHTYPSSPEEFICCAVLCCHVCCVV